MKLLISGAGVAAGALMIAGGNPVAALSQDASQGSSHGAGTAVHSAVQSALDARDGTTDEATTELEASELDATVRDEPQTEDVTAETDADSALDQALAEAHVAAMKAWTDCVREAASGPKVEAQPVPPKSACWPKPLGPGQIRQQIGLTDDADGTEDADETADADVDADGDDGTSQATHPAYGASHGHGAGASHRHHGG